MNPGLSESRRSIFAVYHAVCLGAVSRFEGMQDLAWSALCGGCGRRALFMRGITENKRENPWD